LLHEYFL